MRPVSVTLSNNTSGSTVYSSPVPMNIHGRPEVSLQVSVTGTATYTVQQTVSPIFDTSVTAVWFDHPDSNLVAATASKEGNYAYIPTAIRLALATGSTGSARLDIVQAGIIN